MRSGHSDPGLPLSQLLSLGGDARILIDPKSRRNHYDASPQPEAQLLEYASCTASSISPDSFAAATKLQQRLRDSIPIESSENPSLAENEFERLRIELAAFFGLSSNSETEIVFASSGTDLHLIAAQLSGVSETKRNGDNAPLQVLSLEASETGQGVPAALRARHPSSYAALAGSVPLGEMLQDAGTVELSELKGRGEDGTPIPPQLLDEPMESFTQAAISNGQRVMLIISDLSKTGLLAPSPSAALKILQRYPGRVDILVDACQLRLEAASVVEYIKNGFMVAITGSKFATGPAFSGALLIPGRLARNWKNKNLPASLSAYCARADWPRNWAIRNSMIVDANIGLLLRWEAALTEMKAFQKLNSSAVKKFLSEFSSAVQTHLAADPHFETLPLPKLSRARFVSDSAWDTVPTIFPFILRKSGYLSPDDTSKVAQKLLLQNGKIGQATPLGKRKGKALAALRICSSMRLAVDALSPQGRGTDFVIAGALRLLDTITTLF